jgi:sortase A
MQSNSLKIAGRTSRLLERGLLAAGLILVGIYVAALLHRNISTHLAVWQFEKARSEAAKFAGSSLPAKGETNIDFSLWAAKRIQAYRDSLLSKAEPPEAILEIAKRHIWVPVFEGTDDLTLNRGAGRIPGTAKPGESGNIGIAGHRDGFFRGLKDIAVGDEIELTMAAAKAIYVVDKLEIVNPADTGVLHSRSKPSLTLVTCYPFYFIGDAPKRFIVHASLARPLDKNAQSSAQVR